MKLFHAYARLARAGDVLPWKGRLFGQGTDHPGFEIVDQSDAFTGQLIRDGSIVLEDPPATEAAPEHPPVDP